MIKRVLVLAAAGALATACGSPPTEESANTTSSSTTSPTSTAATTTNVSAEQALYSEYASALTAAGIEFEPGREYGSSWDWDTDTCDDLRSGDLDPYDFATSYGVLAQTGIGPRIITMVPILCPDQQPILDQAMAGEVRQTTFSGGKRLIGNGLEKTPWGSYYLAPGTYRTEGPARDCYWERSDANGNIIDNNSVSVPPSVTVTIAPTDGEFTSRGCGTWRLVE
ncbi:hypothetical protein BFN03_02920 [Rhodococcus sp. WMMA185]|uniref:hypothetical protein n=1 Tax=Rhodococcus sp. WMMA185 TaxID=679318 RepID=UPI000878E4BB|nr:hypothetical protein [Rhodococcus sp. WMMA185]AOW91997.1 hypothetical protein BFN03_02920 [Rhodococcus sp. WMMA185]